MKRVPLEEVETRNREIEKLKERCKVIESEWSNKYSSLEQSVKELKFGINKKAESEERALHLQLLKMQAEVAS